VLLEEMLVEARRKLGGCDERIGERCVSLLTILVEEKMRKADEGRSVMLRKTVRSKETGRMRRLGGCAGEWGTKHANRDTFTVLLGSH
jgi:hypothetical protein